MLAHQRRHRFDSKCKVQTSLFYSFVHKIISISFGNGVVLTVESNYAVLGMISSTELPYTHYPGMTSDWTVYDEVCWFKIVGKNGFYQFHVSSLSVCHSWCVTHDVIRLTMISMYRRWTSETTHSYRLN